MLGLDNLNAYYDPRLKQDRLRQLPGKRFRFMEQDICDRAALAQLFAAEGLDRVFREAGLDWREPGCSMCVGMNGDTGLPGQRIASTSNRNFMGRQGRGVRTHLLSPAMAAAAAVTGRFTDVRRLAAGG